MTLLEVQYVGPLDAVTLPSVGVTVEAGATITVSAEIAAGLLAQPDNWREPAASPAADTVKADN